MVVTRNLRKCKGDYLHGIPITIRLVRTLTGQDGYINSLEYVRIYKITLERALCRIWCTSIEV